MPLQRIGRRVEAAARAELRGQSPETIEKEVRKRLREALFLFELAQRINLETLETVEREQLRRAGIFYAMRCLELEAEIPEYRDFPYGGRSLAEHWGDCRAAVRAFVGSLYGLEEARLLAERRYLDGHPCLFPELAGQWETLLEGAEGLARVYGLMAAEPGQVVKRGSKQARSGLLDLDAVRAAARAGAPARAAELVDEARCNAFDLLGDSEASNSILERRVRRLLEE